MQFQRPTVAPDRLVSESSVLAARRQEKRGRPRKWCYSMRPAASRQPFRVIDFHAQLCRHQIEIMLRDDRSDGDRRLAPARNVLGEPPEICSL